MMRQFIFCVVSLFALSTELVFAQEEKYSVPIPVETEILKTLRKEHPRLLFSAVNDARIKDRIAADPKFAEIFRRIKEKADEMLGEEPVLYEIKVRSQPTILDTSRKAQERVLYLATMFRLTKEKKYLDRAVLELTTVCNFADWNHRCFLDTAEMLVAVGVGFDWLYHDLTPEQRELFRNSIRDKGLIPGKEAYKKNTGWTKSVFNWNQVCSGGLAVGALAIADEEPELAAHLLNKTATGVQRAMSEFAPDGGLREGQGYWSFAVKYNVLMLAALDSALGTDFGLSTFPGFSETGRLRIHLITPLKNAFTFGDTTEKTNSNPWMYWLSRKFNRPDYAWQDRELFTPAHPLALWWFTTEGNGNAEPTTAHFKHAGLVFMRSSWEPDAVYVALKGGSNATGHAHLELGHFQLDGDDRHWLGDLGGVSYTKEYFQGEKRWTFYRATNLAHNIPHIDDKLQNPKGTAPITVFETDSNGKTVTEIDLTDAYKGQVASAKRRIMLENRVVTVEDTFSGVDGKQLTWQVHTPVRRAVVDEKNPRQVDLQHRYKRLRLELLEPSDAIFETEEIVVPEGQPPVKDVTRIVVRRIVGTEPITIKVRFSPQKEALQRSAPE